MVVLLVSAHKDLEQWPQPIVVTVGIDVHRVERGYRYATSRNLTPDLSPCQDHCEVPSPCEPPCRSHVMARTTSGPLEKQVRQSEAHLIVGVGGHLQELVAQALGVSKCATPLIAREQVANGHREAQRSQTAQHLLRITTMTCD